jgi:tetraacyldisaccharide 4'-kinase
MGGAPRFWQTRGLVAWSLLPLAGLFGAITGIRRGLYRRGWLSAVHVGVPVVVVGNLAAGGSGKTPLVIFLAQALAAQGFRVGVVSRGYGGSAQGVTRVTPTSDPRRVGDEPLLIRQKTGVPVVVGRDRVAAARSLLAAHPGIDVILADDGLQHYRLARALELCVVDSVRGLGNRFLLPAGPLREAPGRLKRVDAILVGGDADFSPPGQTPNWRVRRRLGHARRLVAPFETVELAALRLPAPHQHWLAVCGIAHPDGFFTALRAAGLAIVERPFPDHHAFVAGDIPSDMPLLMTEKDAVKSAAPALVSQPASQPASAPQQDAPASGRERWAVTLVAEPAPGFMDWLVQGLRGRR